MEEVMIDLTPAQLRKMGKAKSIQIKPTMIGSGMKIMVSPAKAKRVMKAHRLNKGCRLCMTEQEMEASGLKEWWKGLKTFYKEQVRPNISKPARRILKAGLSTGANAGLQILGAMTLKPEVVAAVTALAPLVDQGVNWSVDAFGDWSGAYGIPNRPMSRRYLPLENMNPYMNPLYNYGDLATGNFFVRT